MVLSSNDNETDKAEDSYSGQLLHDIEEISRALYLDRAPSKALLLPSKHRPSFPGDDVLHKDKKSSIWKWKPLKALTHIRGHRFNCCFFLHVHFIEGLPSNFNDLILCVNWKRKNEVLRTCPVQVFQGIAEFEETLMHQCTIYGNRNGPQNSVKYEPKLFLLNASVIGAPALDIGKHWVDLARLLPLTLEELEEEKRTSGKWTTSFKLKGKAKGATLNVSFGFSVFGNNPFDPSRFARVSDITEGSSRFARVSDITEGSRLTAIDQFDNDGQTSINNALHSVRRKSANMYHHSSSRSLDINFLGDVFSDGKPELAQSISLLCQKLDEGKFGNFEFFHEHPDPIDSKAAPSTGFICEDTGNGLDDAEFVVIDRGIESSMKDELKINDAYPGCSGSVVETIDVTEIFPEDLRDIDENIRSSTKPEHLGNNASDSSRNSSNNKTDGHEESLIVEDPSTILHNLLASESEKQHSTPSTHESQSIEQENYLKPSYNLSKMVRSLSLDDVMDSVAKEFLDMLGTEQIPGDISSDSDSESPRERLLREFERECLSWNNSILDLDAEAEQTEISDTVLSGNGRVACADDFDLSLVIQEAEKEQKRVTQPLRSRRNTQMIENLETESLMRRWGLNENAFHSSPRISSGGFGSPVYLPPQKPYELLPLGEGLGSVIPTKGGGCIRSMNSLLFKSAKNGAKLILQVSKPTVLPALMGSTVMEMLQCWASGGAQKMFSQLNEMMPLEDITGKTMQQLMNEAGSEGYRSSDYSFAMHKNHEESLSVQYSENHNLSPSSNWKSSNYVSLEDIVPLAVAKTEALSVEGLRVQSGLSDEEAPSSSRPEFPRNWASIEEIMKISGVPSSLGISVSHFSDDRREDYLDEIIKLSLPLDQWIKLDRGDISYESETDKWMKILAAYGAKVFDMDGAQLLRNEEGVKLSGSICGLLKDKFTIAFRLQLRDPFRDYEMVGSSMLALAEVERVYVPSQPERSNMKSETDSNTREDDQSEELTYCGTTQELEQESINEVAQFKISEVHVAGINFESNDKQLLSIKRQLQSGSRWLLSNGMNNMGKKRLSSSNALVKSSSKMMRRHPGNILWSLSSHVQCATAKWKELAAFDIHVRNPDVIFPNEPV